MSLLGQPCTDRDDSASNVAVCTFPMPAGTVFDWHTHTGHQLAWAASGVLTVRSGTDAWVLPPTRALWIPAGLRHETLSESSTTMRAAYVRPEGCPIEWPDCTPVVATPLLADLLGYLNDDTLDGPLRTNAERVLVDLLEPVTVVSVDVKMPARDPAQIVASKLVEDPSDDRTLEAWGHAVGEWADPRPFVSRRDGSAI